MKKLMILSLSLAFVVLLLPGPTLAALTYYTANLDGAQEVPIPVVTAATGFAFGWIDDVALTLTWDLNFSGLLAPATVAFFHGPAPIGVNAGVQVPILPFPNATSGHVTGFANLSALQVAELLQNLWYINIHNSIYPAGEIRGQVLAPVPASLLLLGSGLLGLVGLRLGKS